jgi:hypothetical protein
MKRNILKFGCIICCFFLDSISVIPSVQSSMIKNEFKYINNYYLNIEKIGVISSLVLLFLLLLTFYFGGFIIIFHIAYNFFRYGPIAGSGPSPSLIFNFILCLT